MSIFKILNWLLINEEQTDNFFLPYLINQTFLSAHLSTIDSKSFQFQSFFTLKHSTYNKKCILNFIFKTIIKYFPTYIFFSLSCFFSFLQFVWIHNFYLKKMKNTDKLNCSPYLLIPIIFFYPFWICLLNLVFLFAFFILSSAIIHIKFTQLLFVFCFIHFILIKNIIIDLLIFKEKRSNKSSTKGSRLFTFGFFFLFSFYFDLILIFLNLFFFWGVVFFCNWCLFFFYIFSSIFFNLFLISTNSE